MSCCRRFAELMNVIPCAYGNVKRKAAHLVSSTYLKSGSIVSCTALLLNN